jgi:UDP-N-acetylglucosamine 2-epimerase (non-hydrolysing)
VRAFASDGRIRTYLVHTGQHYDDAMSKIFFTDLQIPRPDLNLEVGSGSHAQQTAAIMARFELVLLDQQPDAVLVVGDVNSTIACGLVAAKLHVPLIHVEAGLRSHDRRMPEEINRLLTDAISDLLFVTEPSGVENLRREGVADERIHLVGNVMIDTLRFQQQLAESSTVLERLEVEPGRYGVITLHRPSNVDVPEVFARILDAFARMQQDLPLIFPIHPRTRKNLAALGLAQRVAQLPGLRLVEPLGYLDFLKLMMRAALVLSDSGGIQEETTALGVPCLTLRENTERPITLEEGTNQLVGTDPHRILAGYDRIRSGALTGRVPALWDGHAAERIRDVLLAWHATHRAP